MPAAICVLSGSWRVGHYWCQWYVSGPSLWSLVPRAAILAGVYVGALLGMGRYLSVSLVCVWCILLVTGSTRRDTDRRIHMVAHAAMLTGVFPRYSLQRQVISPSFRALFLFASILF